MVRIRLQRRGRSKRPIHHVVVADSREARDGRIIEDLGRFNNLNAKNEVKLDEKRAIYWLKQGAQPSDTVRSIFRHQGILYKMHLIRWGKSEDEIESALAEWRENREEKQDKASVTARQKQKAMLEAEEKEYQKQLKKKAEEAAKERAKQEALKEAEAKEKEEEEKQAKAEEAKTEAAEEPEEASDSEEQEAKADQEKTEETSEKKEAEKQEAQQEEVEEPEKTADEAEKSAEAAEDEEVEASGESTEGSEETPQEAAEAESKEAEQESTSADEEAEESDEEQEQLSTDLLAKEAISHIEETPLEELEGFVPDDESRVTVQRAWEEKQEG